MAEKKEPKVTKGNIKNGTIELVLLLLLRSEKKYGYQLANELLESIVRGDINLMRQLCIQHCIG